MQDSYYEALVCNKCIKVIQLVSGQDRTTVPWLFLFSIPILSHPGKQRELVPRCPCFCLQLFSVSENPFPCRCTNGTHIASICLFYSISLFLWLYLLNCGCHPKKKKNLCIFLIWVYCEDRVFTILNSFLFWKNK